MCFFFFLGGGGETSPENKHTDEKSFRQQWYLCKRLWTFFVFLFLIQCTCVKNKTKNKQGSFIKLTIAARTFRHLHFGAYSWYKNAAAMTITNCQNFTGQIFHQHSWTVKCPAKRARSTKCKGVGSEEYIPLPLSPPFPGHTHHYHPWHTVQHPLDVISKTPLGTILVVFLVLFSHISTEKKFWCS